MTLNSIGAEAARFGRQTQEIRQEAVSPATNAAPEAPSIPQIIPGSYINPKISWNSEAEILMVEYRDWQTGEPERKFPPEWVASKYQSAEVKPAEAAAEPAVEAAPVAETRPEPAPVAPEPTSFVDTSKPAVGESSGS